jgi:hypothetical protein
LRTTRGIADCERVVSSSSSELEVALAEARYYHDRVALLRAKQYRWGVGATPRLQRLERELQRAERRVSDVRSRQPR